MNIYLHIETSIRELDSKLLLAVMAASKGHQVILSNLNEIVIGLKKKILLPGIFHTKSLTPSEKKISTHQDIIDNGSFISSIDEEGGFLINNQDEFIKKRFSERTIHQASAIFGWGRDIEVLKNKYPQSSSKMFKTGSPRIDLSKSFLKDYWAKPKKAPKKPFLLVSSNLNCNYDQPFYKFIKHFRDLGFYKRNPELFEFQFKEMSEEYIILYSFIDAIKKLSKNNKEFDIVLRPHPRQPLESWKIFLEETSNVHIIKDDAIMPWIKNAFALLHHGCSTAVEAAVAGTPVVSYIPFERKYFQKEFAHKIGYCVKSSEELLQKINYLYENNDNKHNDNTVKESYKTLSERIFIDDNQLSADKIIKVWENLDNKKLSRSNNWIKYYILLKFINLKESLNKILAKFFPKKFKITKQNLKFPPLDENDIYSKVSRFQQILKLNKKLKCKVLSQRTILIKPQ